MNNDVEQLQSLIFTKLLNDSPVMSGNMQMHISMGLSGFSNAEVVIEAPFYDLKKWKKTGAIIPTRENKKGMTDYAYWVNKLGAFGTHNKSERWINRSIYEMCLEYANTIGATVINKLPL
jgi:hypothetical protein